MLFNLANLAAAMLSLASTAAIGAPRLHQVQMTYHDSLVHVLQTQRAQILSMDRHALTRFAQLNYATVEEQRKLTILAQVLKENARLAGVPPEKLTMDDASHRELLAASVAEARQKVERQAGALLMSMSRPPDSIQEARKWRSAAMWFLSVNSPYLPQHYEQALKRRLKQIRGFIAEVMMQARIEQEFYQDAVDDDAVAGVLAALGLAADVQIIQAPGGAQREDRLPRELEGKGIFVTMAFEELGKTADQSRFEEKAGELLESFELRLGDHFPQGGLWPATGPEARLANFEEELAGFAAAVDELTRKRGYKTPGVFDRIARIKARFAEIKERLPKKA